MYKNINNFWSNFFWCFPFIFLTPILANVFYGIELINVRNLQIIWIAVFVIYALCTMRQVSFKMRWQEFLRISFSLKFKLIFWLSATISLCASPVSKYFAGSVAGIDFSIFDQMIYNTYHGRFMYSDLCQCSHFGIHPSLIMLIFLPFHWIFQSPVFLLVSYGLIIVFAAWLTTWLGRRWISQESILYIFASMMLTNPYTGGILNQNFHMEVFYLIFGAFFVYGAITHKKVFFFAGVFGMLCVKEDAPLYLIGLCGQQIVFAKKWRKIHVTVLILSFLVLVFELKIVQPWALGLYQATSAQPGYLARFWGQYGSTHSEIILNMLSSPWIVTKDVLTSNWVKIYACFLFIPLLSGPSLGAILPLLIIYGSSSGDPFMRDFSLYYSAPLLPFLYIGFLHGLDNLTRFVRIKFLNSPHLKPAIQVSVFLYFMITDLGYMRIFKPNGPFIDKLKKLNGVLLKDNIKVCIAEKYIPYLDYRVDAKPFSFNCQNDLGRVLIDDSHTLPGHLIIP